MSKVFKFKHNIATLISSLRFHKEGSRVLMFHDICSSNKLINDLYTIDIGKFQQLIQELRLSDKMIQPFLSQDMKLSSSISVTFDDGYLGNYSLAAPLLLDLSIPFTIFMVSDFTQSKYSEYMNSNHLKELAQHPMVTIGAHGRTHMPLENLPLNEAKEELRVSKMELENILGREVSSMSFPHGSFNIELLEAAKELGYKRCGTSIPLSNNANNDFEVNRQCIFSCDNVATFKQKINGQWDWVARKSN